MGDDDREDDDGKGLNEASINCDMFKWNIYKNRWMDGWMDRWNDISLQSSQPLLYSMKTIRLKVSKRVDLSRTSTKYKQAVRSSKASWNGYYFLTFTSPNYNNMQQMFSILID